MYTNVRVPWQGWAVFVDDDTSGNINGTERVVRVQAISGNGLNLISDAALAGAGNRIAFRPYGLARGHGSLALQTAQVRVCDTSGTLEGDNMRTVSLASGSRMSVSRSTDSACGVVVATPPEEPVESTPEAGG